MNRRGDGRDDRRDDRPDAEGRMQVEDLLGHLQFLLDRRDVEARVQAPDAEHGAEHEDRARDHVRRPDGEPLPVLHRYSSTTYSNTISATATTTTANTADSRTRSRMSPSGTSACSTRCVAMTA